MLKYGFGVACLCELGEAVAKVTNAGKNQLLKQVVNLNVPDGEIQNMIHSYVHLLLEYLPAI